MNKKQSIKDLPFVTVPQVAELRRLAVEMEKRCTQLEINEALYREDAERIWALMPELRDTDAHFEIHEAVHEKMTELKLTATLLAESQAAAAAMIKRNAAMELCLSRLLEVYKELEGPCKHSKSEEGIYCPACDAERLLPVVSEEAPQDPLETGFAMDRL